MLEREIEITERLAQEMGVSEVTLHLFDSGEVETQSVRTEGIKRALRSVRYAGGTNYAELNAVLSGAKGTCVLFSDGRATINDRPQFDGANCRVVAIASGAEIDSAWLAAQAVQGGGQLVTLGTKTNRETIAAIRTVSPIPAITDANGNSIEVRALPAQNGKFRVVGPMPADGAILANGRTISASSQSAPTFTGPGALWAVQHLATMGDSASVEKVAEEARKWLVAVPGVSFIVLETPEDYVEAGFTPPDSYPKDLRVRFEELLAASEQDERSSLQEFETRLRNEWAARKDWWANSQQRKPYKRRQNQNADAASESLYRSGETADAMAADALPSPAAVPMPAPPPPARFEPEGELSAADTVIVTGQRRSDVLQEVPLAVNAVDEQETGSEPAGTIEVAEWSAERPYISEWENAGPDWAYAVANTEKVSGTIPLFYLDLAEWHFRAGRSAEARRAAAAALDLPTRDNQTLEIVAQRLVRYGAFDEAIWLLQQLTDREAERPHPLMALALAYAQRARQTGSRIDLITAHKIMADVGMKSWPDAYEAVNEIALAEANALLVELGGAGADGAALRTEFIDPMPVDIRVTAAWNTARSDIDLWVREPSGEEIGFSNPESNGGARYTHDLTDGYGPEEYQIKRAQSGEYRIEINTFATDRLNPNGPSVVTMRLIRDFGMATQREEMIDVEMQPDAEGRKLVGTITIK